MLWLEKSLLTSLEQLIVPRGVLSVLEDESQVHLSSLESMANEANKKLLARNKSTLARYRLVLLVVNALYLACRVIYMNQTFTRLHAAGFGAILLAYISLYTFLASSGSPQYAPGGQLVSAGVDLDSKGVVE